MLRSMTGFGRGSSENALGRVKVEIKSLNHKFFEVVSKLPVNLTIFEDRIREALQKKIARGRLNLFLSYEKKGHGKDEIFVDKRAGRQYYKRIQDLKRSLGLGGEVRVEQIISLPGVIVYQPQEEAAQKIWPLINKALTAAAGDLMVSKRREGAMLKKNLEHLVDSINRSLNKIRRRTPLVVKEYKQRLLKNVKELTSSKTVLNQQRMEEEAAIFARNSDISEEVHRMLSHITGFKKILSNHDETGRRLDFIAQEMNREINTVGAKANDFQISKEVIKIKSLIEKIREQVQNVE
jgi:uncharacterized protein (TIGR00255 family)